MRQQKNVFGHKIQIMPAPTPAAILVGVTVVVNALLWTSYAVTRPDATDFGNAPSSMHTYMLVMAALAYAANLASLGLLAADARTSAADLYALSQWTALYYGLQLAFIPSVRAAVRGDAGVAPPPCVAGSAGRPTLNWQHARGARHLRGKAM